MFLYIVFEHMESRDTKSRSLYMHLYLSKKVSSKSVHALPRHWNNVLSGGTTIPPPLAFRDKTHTIKLKDV